MTKSRSATALLLVHCLIYYVCVYLRPIRYGATRQQRFREHTSTAHSLSSSEQHGDRLVQLGGRNAARLTRISDESPHAAAVAAQGSPVHTGSSS